MYKDTNNLLKNRVIVVVKPYGYYAKVSDPIYDERTLELTTAQLITECRREYGLFIALEVDVRKCPEDE